MRSRAVWIAASPSGLISASSSVHETATEPSVTADTVAAVAAATANQTEGSSTH